MCSSDLGRWSPDVLRPAPRIVLAGDYTYWNRNQMPYGVSAAIRSGISAADTLRTFLAGREDAAGGGVNPETQPVAGAYPALTSCAVYRLAQDQPHFEGMRDEGNVAFYGYRLMVEPDEALLDYLKSRSRDGLWEDHDGFGATSADSAIVIEGLWRAGVPAGELSPSLDALVKNFFDKESGGFIVVPRGRAAYWSGPSLETTAHIGYLLQMLAPDLYRETIRQAAAFVRRSRNSAGLWTGKWFPAPMLPVFQAARFLASLKQAQDREALVKTGEAIVSRQREDGSWSGLLDRKSTRLNSSH